MRNTLISLIIGLLGFYANCDELCAKLYKQARKGIFIINPQEIINEINNLIDSGVDVNSRLMTNKNRPTALMLACSLNRNLIYPIVKKLLEKGADVKLKDINGKMAIHYFFPKISTFCKDNEVFKLLMSYGSEMIPLNSLILDSIIFMAYFNLDLDCLNYTKEYFKKGKWIKQYAKIGIPNDDKNMCKFLLNNGYNYSKVSSQELNINSHIYIKNTLVVPLLKKSYQKILITARCCLSKLGVIKDVRNIIISMLPETIEVMIKRKINGLTVYPSFYPDMHHRLKEATIEYLIHIFGDTTFYYIKEINYTINKRLSNPILIYNFKKSKY